MLRRLAPLPPNLRSMALLVNLATRVLSQQSSRTEWETDSDGNTVNIETNTDRDGNVTLTTTTTDSEGNIIPNADGSPSNVPVPQNGPAASPTVGQDSDASDTNGAATNDDRDSDNNGTDSASTPGGNPQPTGEVLPQSPPPPGTPEGCFKLQSTKECPLFHGKLVWGSFFPNNPPTSTQEFSAAFEALVKTRERKFQEAGNCGEPLPSQYLETYLCSEVFSESAARCNETSMTMCRRDCMVLASSLAKSLEDEGNCPDRGGAEATRKAIADDTYDQVVCRSLSDGGSCIDGPSNEEETCGFNYEQDVCRKCDSATDATCSPAMRSTLNAGASLSTGGIVGIVIATLLLVVAAGLGYVWYQKRVGKKRAISKAVGGSSSPPRDGTAVDAIPSVPANERGKFSGASGTTSAANASDSKSGLDGVGRNALASTAASSATALPLGGGASTNSVSPDAHQGPSYDRNDPYRPQAHAAAQSRSSAFPEYAAVSGPSAYYSTPSNYTGPTFSPQPFVPLPPPGNYGSQYGPSSINPPYAPAYAPYSHASAVGGASDPLESISIADLALMAADPTVSLQNPYIVLYEYHPSASDEMVLRKHDLVTLWRTFDDGWAYGVNHRTGQVGVVPQVTLQALGTYQQKGGIAPTDIPYHPPQRPQREATSPRLADPSQGDEPGPAPGSAPASNLYGQWSEPSLEPQRAQWPESEKPVYPQARTQTRHDAQVNAPSLDQMPSQNRTLSDFVPTAGSPVVSPQTRSQASRTVPLETNSPLRVPASLTLERDGGQSSALGNLINGPGGSDSPADSHLPSH